MNVDHIDDDSALLCEVRRRGLRQKQGRAQIAPHEIVPRRMGDLAYGCPIEGRCIVDERVEPAEMADGGPDQLLGCLVSLQVRGEEGGGSRARGIQLGAELFRGCGRGSIVHDNACPRRMQRARDLGANTARAAGDEDHLVVERVLDAVRHARSRYRIARAACIGARSARP